MSCEHYADELVGSVLADEAGARLLAATLRLLAEGEAVTVDRLAQASGIPDPDLASAPAGSDIEYDTEGRIVGWGLTLNPTPHSFTTNGRTLYTYCGPDALIFPLILNQPAQVASTCPATGTRIRMQVSPSRGVMHLDPPTRVVTLAAADRIDAAHVRASACDMQSFFADADAAAAWITQHPGMIAVPVAEAFERIARPIAAATGEWCSRQR